MSEYHEMARAHDGTDHHQYRARVLSGRRSLRLIMALQKARLEEAQDQFLEGKLPRHRAQCIMQHAMGFIDGMKKALELFRI